MKVNPEPGRHSAREWISDPEVDSRLALRRAALQNGEVCTDDASVVFLSRSHLEFGHFLHEPFAYDRFFVRCPGVAWRVASDGVQGEVDFLRPRTQGTGPLRCLAASQVRPWIDTACLLKVVWTTTTTTATQPLHHAHRVTSHHLHTTTWTSHHATTQPHNHTTHQCSFTGSCTEDHATARLSQPNRTKRSTSRWYRQNCGQQAKGMTASKDSTRSAFGRVSRNPRQWNQLRVA